MKTEELLARERLRSTPAATGPARLLQFGRQCAYGAEVFHKSNALYADAFEDMGVVGITAELIGVMSKLKTLVLQRSERRQPWQQKEELALLRNAFVDAHNFSNIAMMLLEEGNWNGTPA